MPRSKRALVTGAEGFIGSHLTEKLVHRGYEVRALVQYNSFNNWGWLDRIACKRHIEVLSGDVRDAQFCKLATKDIDTVFHLAALIAIPYSYIAPKSYFDTNVLGTLNVCQAALDTGVNRLVHTSTSEVYGTAQYVPIDEKHPLQPQSPYSASKIGADAVAQSFHLTYELPIITARPFNTYGPRQSARAVIPTIITQIASGAESIHLGDVRPTRDFTYVEDTARGLITLAECDEAVGHTINIGSNNEISIGDTFELIRSKMSSQVELVSDQDRFRPERSEVFRLNCNNARLAELTGFKPEVSISDGLDATIDWFVNPSNLGNYRTGMYNV